MNIAHALLACATCQPDQSTDTARAANFAILFMVIIVFLMLGTLVKIMFNFARRQSRHNNLP